MSYRQKAYSEIVELIKEKDIVTLKDARIEIGDSRMRTILRYERKGLINPLKRIKLRVPIEDYQKLINEKNLSLIDFARYMNFNPETVRAWKKRYGLTFPRDGRHKS